jgi:hypothetical protein
VAGGEDGGVLPVVGDAENVAAEAPTGIRSPLSGVRFPEPGAARHSGKAMGPGASPGSPAADAFDDSLVARPQAFGEIRTQGPCRQR